jgi:hypothetical protein
MGTGVCAVLLLLIVLLRRARRRRPRGSAVTLHIPAPSPTNDHERLAAWAEIARGRLINRFGAAWAAKTTEEIEGDTQLNEALDAATLEKLVELLRAADRAKFAEIADQGADWSCWVDAFLTDAPTAGASSTRNGR